MDNPAPTHDSLGQIGGDPEQIEDEHTLTTNNSAHDTTTSDTPLWSQFLKMVPAGGVHDRIIGALFGHALGDAVGLATEFKARGDITTVVFPPVAAVKGFTPGDWTDETDNMIVVLALIAEAMGSGVPAAEWIETNLAPRLAADLAHWTKDGFAELGDIFGHGATPVMKMITGHREFEANPVKTAESIWTSSGGKLATNESLTRSAAAVTIDARRCALAWAAQASRTTHADPRCTTACIFYTSILHSLVYDGLTDAASVDSVLQTAISEVQSSNTSALADATELSAHVQTAYTKNIVELKLDDISKMTYVYKTLGAAIYSLQVIRAGKETERVPSFKKVIKKIAAEGGDADANCAVAGAVLGAYLGYSGLPARWIVAMPNAAWLGAKIMAHPLMKNLQIC
jgi:ADP-ribosylglycohydrolase